MIQWRILITGNHGANAVELQRAYLTPKRHTSAPIWQAGPVFSDSGQNVTEANRFENAYLGTGPWRTVELVGPINVWGIIELPDEEYPVELVLKAGETPDRAPAAFKLQYRLATGDPWTDWLNSASEPAWAIDEERRYLVTPAYLSGSTKDQFGQAAARTITVIRSESGELIEELSSEPGDGTFSVPAQRGELYDVIASDEPNRNALIFAGVTPYE